MRIALEQAGGSADRLRREDILVTLIREIERVYGQWCNEEDDAIVNACRRRMSTLGRPVRLTIHGRTVEGIVMALDDDGRLIVRESTGTVSGWSSGDVEEVRLAETQ
jgi:biotin-(acetyl-CoA carboxylase) ligase